MNIVFVSSWLIPGDNEDELKLSLILTSPLGHPVLFTSVISSDVGVVDSCAGYGGKGDTTSDGAFVSSPP